MLEALESISTQPAPHSQVIMERALCAKSRDPGLDSRREM